MLLDRGAAHLEAAPDDLLVENSRVWVKGAPGRNVAFRALVEPDRVLEASHRYDATKMTYPYGAHAAVVEVDAATGAISILDYAIAYDVGRAVNPKLVEGQLVGGLAQGVGGAILEELVYADDGQPLSVTFMDYLLPTFLEMPANVTVKILEETPTPLNPLGVKGAGEGGTAAAGAAIANAVADALRPVGVEITDLPLSPARIVSLVRDATTRDSAQTRRSR
jgi:carbon-monoxide dehydrogenase large subunit/6-hydroxypseudooxynicotine dehydrogenase subunit gamma